VLVVVAVLLGLVVPSAWAGPSNPATVRPEMLRILEALRKEAGAPGAAITFGNGDHDVTLSSGSGRAPGNQPIEATDKVRVGSDTKTFVAVVALDLVGERRLELDVPIDRYLPGVLRYPADKVPGDPAAYDGRTVTLRQLLQHTAGVPEYADLPYILNPMHQLTSPTPEDFLAHALPQGPGFLPGTSWRYSNTDYALVGMIIHSVTGRSLGEEIHDRIVQPLGLANTFFAERYQKDIPGRHVRGYLNAQVPLDLTGFEPGIWGAAGALVSSADDMNTFNSALLAGRVLSPDLLRELRTTVPYGSGGYGLGIVWVRLSCGDAWGHAGFLAGYQTFGLAMANGRHAFFTMNSTYALVTPAQPTSGFELMELALC
jgi:D-alanyl-D-alanine carboxypeptidase